MKVKIEFELDEKGSEQLRQMANHFNKHHPTKTKNTASIISDIIKETFNHHNVPKHIKPIKLRVGVDQNF